MHDDSYKYLIGGFIAVLVFVFAVMLFSLLIHASHQGDVENTKRTKARYEMCATIPDPNARTLCSLDIKTGY